MSDADIEALRFLVASFVLGAVLGATVGVIREFTRGSITP